jgi:hypothetical protein
VTRYVPAPLAAPRIEPHQIPRGFRGTRRTAAFVARLIRDGARDFYVRQKAIDILLAAGVAAKDYTGEVDALFRWVQRNVRYTKDPFHVEVLHAPRRMLELRAGDCDDMTILLGALVKSVGHPVRLVLTGPNATRPDLFSHIYLEAQCQGDWIPLDATMPFAMGWSPNAPVRLVLSVEEESNDDHPITRSTRATTAAHADGTVDNAPTRVAPRSVARHTNGRGAATRPAGEGAVGSTAPPSAARKRCVDTDDAALHLAARARPTPSSSYNTKDSGAAQRVGGSRGTSTTPRQRRARLTSDPPDAAPASRIAAASGDGATAAATSTARVAKGTPLNEAVNDASTLYSRFTRLPARSVQRITHQRVMPPVVVELGRLMAIVYRSDKWVGHPRTYIHYMEDPPRLVSDTAGRRLFLIGGSYRITARGIEG